MSHALTAIVNNTGTVLAELSAQGKSEEIVEFFKAMLPDYLEEMIEAVESEDFIVESR